MPTSRHLDMVTLAPRSLKLPVGFRVSSFANTRDRPRLAPQHCRGRRGVSPSMRLTMCPGLRTGSRGPNHHMLRPRFVKSVSLSISPRAATRSYLASRKCMHAGHSRRIALPSSTNCPHRVQARPSKNERTSAPPTPSPFPSGLSNRGGTMILLPRQATLPRRTRAVVGFSVLALIHTCIWRGTGVDMLFQDLRASPHFIWCRLRGLTGSAAIVESVFFGDVKGGGNGEQRTNGAPMDATPGREADE